MEKKEVILINRLFNVEKKFNSLRELADAININEHTAGRHLKNKTSFCGYVIKPIK